MKSKQKKYNQYYTNINSYFFYQKSSVLALKSY